MKNLMFFTAIALLTFACAPKERMGKSPATELTSTSIDADSLEHEIIILDPEFERWYQTRYSEANDRSNEYYQSMNRIGTLNWNQYYNTGSYSRIIASYIDYQNGTDYGIEVNRKLFWYFKYIEEKFRIRLLR